MTRGIGLSPLDEGRAAKGGLVQWHTYRVREIDTIGPNGRCGKVGAYALVKSANPGCRCPLFVGILHSSQRRLGKNPFKESIMNSDLRRRIDLVFQRFTSLRDSL
jgi:hypothetical protein